MVNGWTYKKDMPQCVAALSAATSKRDNPTRVTVGTIARGVIQVSSTPIIPVPITLLGESPFGTLQSY